MKCYKHLSEDIVVQCHSCGKGLCSPCSKRFTSILCDDCLVKGNREFKKQTMKDLAISAGIFVFFIFNLSGQTKGHQSMPLPMIIVTSYMMASIPWGWRLLGSITPQVFLILPLIGWFVYLIFKLWLSAITGFFIAPYKIYRAVKDIRELNATETNVSVQVLTQR